MTYQLDGVMFKKVIYQLVFWWHFWLFFSVEHCTISATKWIFFVEPDDDKLQREFCTNKLVTKCCLQSASKRSLEDNSKSSFLYSATCYLTYVWETVESSFEKKYTMRRISSNMTVFTSFRGSPLWMTQAAKCFLFISCWWCFLAR